MATLTATDPSDYTREELNILEQVFNDTAVTEVIDATKGQMSTYLSACRKVEEAAVSGSRAIIASRQNQRLRTAIDVHEVGDEPDGLGLPTGEERRQLAFVASQLPRG